MDSLRLLTDDSSLRAAVKAELSTSPAQVTVQAVNDASVCDVDVVESPRKAGVYLQQVEQDPAAAVPDLEVVRANLEFVLAGARSPSDQPGGLSRRTEFTGQINRLI